MLEDQIDLYAYEHFDPSATAQTIFATSSENEITKKLEDMSEIQRSIEKVLKETVKSNYSSFLYATEQINQVGLEMSELRQLITNTQKLITVRDMQLLKVVVFLKFVV